MAEKTRQKFATQVDVGLLDAVRGIAKEEGRQVQSLIDEALADLIEKRRLARPRPQVMATYRLSVERYGKLYKKLAQ